MTIGTKDIHARRYTRNMAIISVIYSVTVIGTQLIDNNMILETPVRIILALLPTIPAVVMLGIIVGFIRTRDEVWQRIITEGTLWGCGFVGIAGFAYGFLGGAIDLPEIHLFWLLPAMIATSSIATFLVRMRLG